MCLCVARACRRLRSRVPNHQPPVQRIEGPRWLARCDLKKGRLVLLARDDFSSPHAVRTTLTPRCGTLSLDVALRKGARRSRRCRERERTNWRGATTALAFAAKGIRKTALQPKIRKHRTRLRLHASAHRQDAVTPTVPHAGRRVGEAAYPRTPPPVQPDSRHSFLLGVRCAARTSLEA